MQDYELISFPAEQGIIQIAQAAGNNLFIAVPYIKAYGVKTILNHARASNVRLLTNFDLANITGSGFDVAALLTLWDRFALEVSSLSKLHAKVYIADNRIALVTSANLTRGGLRENYEYGVILRDERVVSAMLEDMTAYFNLGNRFSRETIENILGDIETIADLRKDLENRAEAKRLRNALKQREGALRTKILTNRIKEGRTINAIFAETIEYLLRTKGPLSTRELQPLIQNIHSDICDDALDLVINGQYFGKKWKHDVRNSQVYLRRNGTIYLKGEKWCLTMPPNQTFGM